MPFSLSAFMPYRLAVLAERVSRRLAVDYGPSHGLSVAEWRVMVHLGSSGTVSVREIHECVNLDKPRVSRAVSRMEAAGLVVKQTGQEDGRLVEIALTRAGQAALAEILPIVIGIEEELLSEISAEDRALFFSVMERIHAKLDKDPKARKRAKTDYESLPEA